MIRLYVLGPHLMAWGCQGCMRIWWDVRREVAEGKRAPREDVRRFRTFAEGQTIEHDHGPRRRKGLLYVREVPA